MYRYVFYRCADICMCIDMYLCVYIRTYMYMYVFTYRYVNIHSNHTIAGNNAEKEKQVLVEKFQVV